MNIREAVQQYKDTSGKVSKYFDEAALVPGVKYEQHKDETYMNIRESIQRYSEALSDIQKYFDGALYGGFDDLTDNYWAVIGRSVEWAEDKESLVKQKGNYFSGEICGERIFEKEEFSLAYIDNGCGDQYYILLDNSKRVPEEEIGEE